MMICKDCRCFHPVSVSDRYCGECCIGDAKKPIAINEDITGCCLFEPKQPKPKLSNADRIRQMTDEELADFLLESRSRCKLCKKQDEICEGAYHECWNGIDDWLKQEVSEDAGTD